MKEVRDFRRRLLGWYGAAKRDLPWRRTRDPYRIWVSEVMLQQTRVTAAIPYYERFLARFPTVESLAAAETEDVLTLWAGLGYYSRARNLQAGARQVVAAGGFPRRYEQIREIKGVGEYTAAAVASIAFGLPHAVLDGNVARVLSRFLAEPGDVRNKATRDRLRAAGQRFLDPRRPGEFNQALMELGATLCLPRDPRCLLCPLREDCRARQQGRQNEFPVKAKKQDTIEVEMTVAVIRRNGSVLLWRRGEDSGRMAGFWELPEERHLPSARRLRVVGTIRHGITNHAYRVEVVESVLRRAPASYRWVKDGDLASIPLSTIARKALNLFVTPSVL